MFCTFFISLQTFSADRRMQGPSWSKVKIRHIEHKNPAAMADAFCDDPNIFDRINKAKLPLPVFHEVEVEGYRRDINHHSLTSTMKLQLYIYIYPSTRVNHAWIDTAVQAIKELGLGDVIEWLPDSSWKADKKKKMTNHGESFFCLHKYWVFENHPYIYIYMYTYIYIHILYVCRRKSGCSYVENIVIVMESWKPSKFDGTR